MKIKRFISLATTLAVLFFLLPQTALAYASITDNNVGLIYYIKSGDFAVIAGIDFTVENAYLPSEIDGSPLEGIDSISGGQTVKSITLPSTITSISDGAFSAQTALSSIFVDEGNNYYSSENGVLFNKDKTTLVCYPPNAEGYTYAVPSSIKTIAQSSFENCANLKSLLIGNNIEKISCTFSTCGALDSIYFFGTESEWEAVSKASEENLPTVHFIAASDFGTAEDLSATVIYGNSPILPSSAKAVCEDGGEITAPVEWDFSAIDGAGQYTVKGRAYSYDIYEAQLSVLPCAEATDDILRYFGCQNEAYQAHKFQNTYSGKVHFEFDLKINNTVDGIVAFSSNSAVYSTEAIGIRPGSPMSARNGGSWVDFYTPVLGETYRFDIETDTLAHTWSAVMTAPNGEKTSFADNYGYRKNQDTIDRILLARNTSTFAYVDDVYLCNLKISISDSYIPVSGIDMPSSLEIEEGTDKEITVSVLPSNATNQSFTCTSSDESVLTYENGIIHALSEGTATLTATTSDGGYSAACTVTVTKNTSSSYGLIAYYPFDEYITDTGATYVTIADASGCGNNATAINISAPFSASNGTAHFPGDYYSGKTGSALQLPASINRGVTDFTYSAWVKANSSYTYNTKLVRLFDFGNIASNNARNSIFMRYTPSSGELYLCDRLPNVYCSQTYSDLPFTDKWGLLTVTFEYNSGSGYYDVTTYINGVKQEALSASGKFTRSLTDLGELDDTSNGLFIGRTVWGATNQYVNDNPDFCGDMDEIRLYNRALSAEEVALLYNEHKPSELMSQADIKVITQIEGAAVSEDTVSADINSSYAYTAASLTEYNGEVYALDEASSTLYIENVQGEENIVINYVKAAFTYEKPQFLTCVGMAPSLPQTVTFTVNGESRALDIMWDNTAFAEKGEYTISGTIEGTNVTVYSDGRVFPAYNGVIGGDLTVNYYADGILQRSEAIEQAYGTEFILSTEAAGALGVMYAFEGAEGAVWSIGESVVLDELYQNINLYYTLKNTIEGTLSAQVRESGLNGTGRVLSINAEVFNLTDKDETVSIIAADYDQKGRSSIIYEGEITLPRETAKIETISASVSYTEGQYNNLEIMLWTDDLMPLYDIVSVNSLDVKPYLSEEVTNMMPTYESACAAIRKANSYWQSAYPYPSSDTTGGTHAAFWDKAAYQSGNMEAYKLLGEEDYLTYAVNWANYCEWKGNTYTGDSASWTWGYNQSRTSTAVLFGDWQTCFQTFIDLYNLGVEGASLDRVNEVMGYQVTTDEDSYWWWADALYMVMPVMTKLYNLTGDTVYLDKLYEWFKYAKELMYDGEGGIPTDASGYTTSAALNSGAQYSDPDNYAHLFFRDAGYVYPLQPNSGHETEKNFWSRGNGWVFAALAKVLADMPVTYEHYDEFYSTYTQMASAIISCQQTDENGYGFWTQSMLQDYPKGNNGNNDGYETSGTAFFTYGLFWGINNGILDEDTYLEPAVRAWGYLENVALQSDGKVGYVQPIGSNATSATPASTTQNFGVGAFLLASCEAARWAQ